MNITESSGQRKEKRAMPSKSQRYMTVDEVKKWFKDNGISVKKWCEANDVSLNSVNAIFRGKGHGSRGKTHDAMVKLGMKPDPKILYNPCKPQPFPLLKEAKR